MWNMSAEHLLEHRRVHRRVVDTAARDLGLNFESGSSAAASPDRLAAGVVVLTHCRLAADSLHLDFVSFINYHNYRPMQMHFKNENCFSQLCRHPSIREWQRRPQGTPGRQVRSTASALRLAAGSSDVKLAKLTDFRNH